MHICKYMYIRARPRAGPWALGRAAGCQESDFEFWAEADLFASYQDSGSYECVRLVMLFMAPYRPRISNISKTCIGKHMFCKMVWWKMTDESWWLIMMNRHDSSWWIIIAHRDKSSWFWFIFINHHDSTPGLRCTDWPDLIWTSLAGQGDTSESHITQTRAALNSRGTHPVQAGLCTWGQHVRTTGTDTPYIFGASL